MENENRLIKVEDRLTNIQSDLSAIRENSIIMGKTLSTLADIRSETLHLMREQDKYNKEQDNIFVRVRELEKGSVACKMKHTATQNKILALEKHQTIACNINHTTIKNKILALEKNQRWVVLFIIGSILTYVIPKVFN